MGTEVDRRIEHSLRKKGLRYQKASLTVEAALVMPIFLYFMIAFLYFLQIFMVQEQIQSEITRMGLDLARAAYFYQDFPDVKEAVGFDKSIIGEELEGSIDEISDYIISGASLKLYARKYLDKDFVNQSCIKRGFDGIDFNYSSVTKDADYVDIVIKYKVALPIKIFILGDMSMLQRVRLRSWTGYEVAATYTTESDTEETIVYITETGTVYHKSRDCSHIKLSIKAVQGIPTGMRNESGSRYTRCEECCTGKEGINTTYYIAAYGTKYHTNRSCSGIKRSVKEIPLSKVGARKPCSRCCK